MRSVRTPGEKAAYDRADGRVLKASTCQMLKLRRKGKVRVVIRYLWQGGKRNSKVSDIPGVRRGYLSLNLNVLILTTSE